MSELCMGSYQRHYYRLGAPVREIVRRAQEILIRSQLGLARQFVAGLLEKFYGGGNYPQSLGELCLEIHEDALRRAEMEGYAYWGWYGDVDRLRVAMWHKNG